MNESKLTDFKEIKDVDLSSKILLQFMGAYRRALSWEKTKNSEAEVLFLIAFILMFPLFLLFGVFKIFAYFPLFLVFWWIAATSGYFIIRYGSDDNDVKEAEKAIDTITKAIKRGRIGLRRKEGAKDGYELVGVYHNDLIDETVEDYIDFGLHEFNQIYDALDEVGAFPNRGSIVGKEILFTNDSNKNS